MQAPALPLSDEAATRALGQRLALAARAGDVMALSGPLGIGKSVLARAFIRALTTPEEEVPSPTFTLVQLYDGLAGPLWHFDLYRLAESGEVLELGFEDAVAGGIVLVEWAERLGALLPRRRLDLALGEGTAEGARIARVQAQGGSDWLARAGFA